MSNEDQVEIDAVKKMFREMGEHILDTNNFPRHPRGFKGQLVYEETIPVVIARDPLTGRRYAIEPTELQLGQGETPDVRDVFARDYAVVGTRRGTSIVDLIFRAVPIVTGGGGWGGLIEEFFGKKR